MIDISRFLPTPAAPLSGARMLGDAIGDTADLLARKQHQEALEEHARQELATQREQGYQRQLEAQQHMGLQQQRLGMDWQQQLWQQEHTRLKEIEGVLGSLADANSSSDPYTIDAVAQELNRRGVGARAVPGQTQPMVQPSQAPAPQQPAAAKAPPKKLSPLDSVLAGKTGTLGELQQAGQGSAFDTTIVPTKDPLESPAVQTVSALRQTSPLEGLTPDQAARYQQIRDKANFRTEASSAVQSSQAGAPPEQTGQIPQLIPQEQPAPRGGFVAPPLPSMQLTPPIGPRDPAHGTVYEVFDKNTGQVLGRYDHTALRQYQEQKIRAAFAPYESGSDPLEKEIAGQVRDSTIARLGTGEPLDKLINSGLSNYQHRLATESQSRRHRVGGTGGGASGVSKTDFARGSTMLERVHAAVREVRAETHYQQTVDGLAFADKGLAQLESNNGMGDALALSGLTQSIFGKMQSDREFKRIFESAGKWESWKNELNKYTNGGRMPEGLVGELRQAFRTMQQVGLARQQDTEQRAYNAASAAAKILGANEEEAAQLGDYGRQYSSGKFQNQANVVPENAKATKQGVFSRSKPTKEQPPAPAAEPKKPQTQRAKDEASMLKTLENVERKIGKKSTEPAATAESPDEKRKREARERALRAIGGG